jgi:hypothetical protein
VSSIRRVARSLLSIVLFKVPLSWLMVGGAFVAASGLLPGDFTTSQRLAMGLVLGALAVGTSPAVSVAVIAESGAKGKTPDTILSIAVFKDIVMILMLAVALAFGNVLVDPGVLLALGRKIALSLVAGAILGGALIAWMRWVRWELVLSLVIIGFGGTALAGVLRLKPLLVFISAGFVVANFSRHGHALHKPLSLLALPVFASPHPCRGRGERPSPRRLARRTSRWPSGRRLPALAPPTAVGAGAHGGGADRRARSPPRGDPCRRARGLARRRARRRARRGGGPPQSRHRGRRPRGHGAPGAVAALREHARVAADRPLRPHRLGHRPVAQAPRSGRPRLGPGARRRRRARGSGRSCRRWRRTSSASSRRW